MPLLKVENLTIDFHTRRGVTHVVRDLSFAVDTGKTLGIVGESGSGKSVTSLALMGLLPTPPAQVQATRIHFADEELLQLDKKRLRQLRGNRIAMIFQDPMTALNPYLSIGKQLIEPLLIHQSMTRHEAHERALAALAETGIPQARKRMSSYPHEFSGGMRQRVMIAMAMLNRPALLIADEPTTALDVTVQSQILDLMQALQHQYSLSIIFITHDLGVIAGLADDVMVMEKGRCVETGSVDDIFYHSKETCTQRLLNAIPQSAKPPEYANSDISVRKNLLELANVSIAYPQKDTLFRPTESHTIVEHIDLQVKKGEILGLVGESGSGKSSLARALVRLVRLKSGRIYLDAEDITDLSDHSFKSIRPRIQMIFQDPYASLNPRMTIHDCLAEAICCRSKLSNTAITTRVTQLLEEVDLDASQRYKYPHEFSGGQRQRIAIARALALEPELILADEPVSALDVTVQAHILDLFMRLNKKHHLSFIFISHDLSVVRYVADRTAIMYQGKIVELDSTEKVFHSPQHHYTQTLLAAIPLPDPEQERKRKRKLS